MAFRQAVGRRRGIPDAGSLDSIISHGNVTLKSEGALTRPGQDRFGIDRSKCRASETV